MKTIKKTVRYLKEVCFLFFSLFSLTGYSQGQGTTERLLTGPGVAILNIDVNRPVNKIDAGIYGQFLEHINHSVVDGLFAKQVQGRGFEGTDFETYWKSSGINGAATVIATTFKNGEKSLQFKTEKGTAGIMQSRIYLLGGKTYSGSIWVNNVEGSLKLTMSFKDSTGVLMKEIPLKVSGKAWQEVPFTFISPKTDTQAKMEIEAKGTGTLIASGFHIDDACRST